MRKKKEKSPPSVVVVDGEECMAVVDAARIKGVGVTAIYFFHNYDRQDRNPVLEFKEVGGMLWVTMKSLKEWSPKPYRHYRPENLRGEIQNTWK